MTESKDITNHLPPIEEETGKVAGSALEIYNLLLAGEKISVTFSSMAEATNLRNAIAVVKFRQEAMAVGIGLLTKEELLSFSFTIISRKEPSVQAVLSFVEREGLLSNKRRFHFEIIR